MQTLAVQGLNLGIRLSHVPHADAMSPVALHREHHAKENLIIGLRNA